MFADWGSTSGAGPAGSMGHQTPSSWATRLRDLEERERLEKGGFWTRRQGTGNVRHCTGATSGSRGRRRVRGKGGGGRGRQGRRRRRCQRWGGAGASWSRVCCVCVLVVPLSLSFAGFLVWSGGGRNYSKQAFFGARSTQIITGIVYIIVGIHIILRFVI